MSKPCYALNDEVRPCNTCYGDEFGWNDCHAGKQSLAYQLAEALRNLMDEQNGPPLITHEKTWNEAMDLARAALKKSGVLE